MPSAEGENEAYLDRQSGKDPSGEIGIMKMADNAAAEKSRPPNTVTRLEDIARGYPAGFR